MLILDVLTIIFVFAKIFNLVTFAWPIIFLPLIINIVINLFRLILVMRNGRR